MSHEKPNFPHNPHEEGVHSLPPKFDLPVIPFDEETHAGSDTGSIKPEFEVLPPEKAKPLTQDQIAALNEAKDWSRMTSGQILNEINKIRGTTPDYFEQVPQPYAKLTADGLLVISTGYLRATPGDARKKYLQEQSEILGHKINEQEILAYIERKYPNDSKGNHSDSEQIAHSA